MAGLGWLVDGLRRFAWTTGGSVASLPLRGLVAPSLSVGLGGDVCGLAGIGRSVGVVGVGLRPDMGAGDVVGDIGDWLKTGGYYYVT